MKEQQARVIRELREQGVGYSTIGSRIGLSRDIVRNFCKAKSLLGFGKALVKNMQEQVMLGKHCGNSYLNESGKIDYGYKFLWDFSTS